MKVSLKNENGVSQVLHKDHDNKVTIETKHDVSNVLKANKFQRDHAPLRHEEEVFNHKARIDTVALMEWLKQRGKTWQDFMTDENLLRAFLNDPDNEMWLTRKGKV